MFARRMSYLESSGIRKMFELKANMKNPIDLSLGQADFDAPADVKRATIEAIEQGKNGYTVTSGLPELHSTIERSLIKEGVSPEALLVVSGAEGGLLLSLLALTDESVEVLVPEPHFATYLHLIKLAGATPRPIDTYPDFRLTPEKLRASVTEKTRVLLFNSPCNPTGVAYRSDELSALAKTAKELKLQVISDEVYDCFSYDHPHESWLKHDRSGLLIRSLSKTCGVAGWRVGYAAGSKELIDHMTTLQQFSFICAPQPAQWGAVVGFSKDRTEHLASYRKKRDLVVEKLSPHFNFHKPEGAFYIFPEYPKGMGKEFMQKCIEKEVLVVPGTAFSSRNTHFRISFATDDDTLNRGLDLIVDVARSL